MLTVNIENVRQWKVNEFYTFFSSFSCDVFCLFSFDFKFEYDSGITIGRFLSFHFINSSYFFFTRVLIIVCCFIVFFWFSILFCGGDVEIINTAENSHRKKKFFFILFLLRFLFPSLSVWKKLWRQRNRTKYTRNDIFYVSNCEKKK